MFDLDKLYVVSERNGHPFTKTQTMNKWRTLTPSPAEGYKIDLDIAACGTQIGSERQIVPARQNREFESARHR